MEPGDRGGSRRCFAVWPRNCTELARDRLPGKPEAAGWPQGGGLGIETFSV